MGPSADTHALNARLLRFRSHPDQEDAYALAEDLIAAQRYGDARGVVVSAQSDDGEQLGRLLVLEGRAWYMDRDLVRAQATLVKAAKLDASNGDAFRWLGEVLLERDDATRATRALERAAQLAPGNADVTRLLERARQPQRRAPVAAAPVAAPIPASAPVRAAVAGGTAAALRGGASNDTAPALRGGASNDTAPALRGGASLPVAPPVQRPVHPAFAKTMSGAAIPSLQQAAPRAPIAAPPPPVASSSAARATFSSTPRQESRVADTALAPLRGLVEEALDEEDFTDLSDGGLEAPPSSAGMRSSPGSKSSPGKATSPGVVTTPGSMSSPGRVTSPGNLSSDTAPAFRGASSDTAPALRGGASSPGVTSSPGLRTAPGSVSSPGRVTTPGSVSSPGRVTTPGNLSSPGRVSSPGVASSPGRLSTPGDLSSPGRVSTPGNVSSPGRVSSPGQLSSPGLQPSPVRASTPSGLSAPRAWERPAFDVDVEEADEITERKISTAPGLVSSPSHEPASPSGWEAASVVARWPEQEALLGEDEVDPADLEGAAARGAALALRGGASSAADLALGADVGQADDPAAVLELLRAQGIYEPAEAGAPSNTPWSSAKQVERSGPRLRNTLIGVWGIALALTAGGYFGWQRWVEYRHAQAAELLKDAKAAAFESDYKRLVDAERMLRLARDKHPRSPDIARVELFVHMQRVLENGNRDVSGLRSALIRAEALQKSTTDSAGNDNGAYMAAARAVRDVYGGAPAEAAQSLAQAQQAAKGEAALLYVVGRLDQRVGQTDATALLQAAAAAAPDLIAAPLALAEQQAQAGNEPEAIAAFDAILKSHPGHLRAGLWRAFLLADRDDPAQGLHALDAMSKGAHNGAPIDRILFALACARLEQRQGAHDKAADALRDALAGGASEPRLLALVASEARRVGQLGLAQQAASQAVAAAPQASAYRALLARILIERQDGEHALSLLAEGAADDPALQVMRAQAALMSSSADAQRDGLKAVEAYLASNAGDVAAASLRIRLQAELDPNPKLLADAKALLRRAPGDPAVLRALAEVALALHAPDDAKSALEQLVAASPSDPEAHQLLGRARRLAGDAGGAEASFRRAVELQPGYPPALAALGSLLLDMGKYTEADAAYQELCVQSPLACRLGRAEALIALNKLDDAQAQLSGLSQPQQDSAAGRETAARLALARKKPGDAIALLRPLVDAADKHTSTLVLYGDALYGADQVNPAAGAYDAALAIDADLPEALLGRAEVHLRAERAQDALDLLEKAKAALQVRLRAPELRARMLTLYGHAYVQRNKRGDLEAARDSLRKALQMNPPSEAYFWLGEAVAGKITPEAAAALKHYLEIEPDGYYAVRAKRSLGPLL